jgi:porphobilinogen synthase
MVKPALAYLDIIAQLAARSTVPVVAYQVSGEYEMLQGLAKAGLAPLEGIVIETLSAIRRAGAQLIVSYFASTAAEKGWITK